MIIYYSVIIKDNFYVIYIVIKRVFRSLMFLFLLFYIIVRYSVLLKLFLWVRVVIFWYFLVYRIIIILGF